MRQRGACGQAGGPGVTVVVIGFQAKKDEPDNPGNKIAFTLNGHLCAIMDPRAANEIIKGAYDDIASHFALHYRMRAPEESLWQETKFKFVADRIAGRRDLRQIARRA